MLDGYKTYISAALAFAAAGYEIFVVGDMKTGFEMFVAGLGIVGIRSKLESMTPKE